MATQLLTQAHPELAEEYATQNPKPLHEVTLGLGQAFTWNCSTCGHSWTSRISHRISHSSDCPSCSKKILSTSNPELIPEWSTQNTTTPADHKPGERTRVWWKCLNGHPDYQMAVAHHRLRGSGCRQCGPVKTGKSLAEVAPQLVAEWSPANKQTPDQVYAKSAEAGIWVCLNCSHEWTTRVAYRVERGSGCPKCNNRVVADKSIALLRPDLAKEWSSKNAKTASEIAIGANNLHFWECKLGHEFKMRPVERQGGSNCPECRLLNGSIAAKHPSIVSQFDITKNGTKTPHNLLAGSGTPVWWKCEFGHSWKISPASRGSKKHRMTGCPDCVKSSTSDTETQLRQLLTEDGTITAIVQQQNTSVALKWRKRSSLNVDVLGKFEGHPVVVEYDGWYWHSDQIKGGNESFIRDTDKTKALLEAGYIVIRIREAKTLLSLARVPLNHTRLLQVTYHYDANQTFTDSLREDIYAWLHSLRLPAIL